MATDKKEKQSLSLDQRLQGFDQHLQEEQTPASFSFLGNNTSFMSVYRELEARESHLLQQLFKAAPSNVNNNSNNKNGNGNTNATLLPHLKKISLSISLLLEQKQQILEQFRTQLDNVPMVISEEEESAQVLEVAQQPSGIVAANKYLEPAVVVRVISHRALELARAGKLQVVASLSLALSGELLGRTIDNKQEILQGNLIVPVSNDGVATFNKLKIMEVSSKHQQMFLLNLQLQKIRKPGSLGGNTISIGEPVQTAPLHVQSRSTKRKRASSGSNGRQRKRSRGESDCSYVDITSLLILPQKEAATRLGISESMLCKRFKECTRRKWPYRYLRKIDKMIRVLTLNKRPDALPRDDLEKIQRLKKEREECLQPVKIRITGSDKVQSLTEMHVANGSKESTSESEFGSPYLQRWSTSAEEDEEDYDENDDDENKEEIDENGEMLEHHLPPLLSRHEFQQAFSAKPHDFQPSEHRCGPQVVIPIASSSSLKMQIHQLAPPTPRESMKTAFYPHHHATRGNHVMSSGIETTRGLFSRADDDDIVSIASTLSSLKSGVL